jgi:PAS domain S-box-containing protein
MGFKLRKLVEERTLNLPFIDAFQTKRPKGGSNYLSIFLIFYFSAVLALLALTFALSSPLGATRGIFYIVLVLTSLWSPWRSDALLIATCCTAFMFIGLIFPSSGSEGWDFMDNRLLTTFAIWATAIVCFKKKAVDHAIRKSEEKYRTLFEEATDAIEIVDQEGRMVDCNQNACDFLGYERHELLEKMLHDIVPSDIKDSAAERLSLVLEKGTKEVAPFDSFALRKDGTKVPVEISLTFIEIDGRKRVIYFLRETTARKSLEERLRQSQKLEALGQLASGVAHDFNNALAIILGRAELTNTPSADPKVRKSMEIIEKAALSGAKTVKRLQNLARRREDRPKGIVHLHSVLSDVLDITRPRWKSESESRGLSISLTLEPRAMVDAVTGDESDLEEVFINLINNAIDAMPEGGKITLSTENDGGEIIASVVDTGIGMGQEVLERAPEPFYTTKDERGTGLGLSMVYGIVERHEGRLEIESTPGEGTAVRLRLPTVAGVMPAPKVLQEVQEPQPEETFMSPDSLRFLIIDDEKEIVNSLAEVLMEAGHLVELATNPQDGLNKFRKNEFALVFTDLAMPGIPGWEVAKQIRLIDPSVPIVLITGWGVELEEEKIARSGVDLVLSKPFAKSEVLRSVQDTLVHRRVTM